MHRALRRAASVLAAAILFTAGLGRWIDDTAEPGTTQAATRREAPVPPPPVRPLPRSTPLRLTVPDIAVDAAMTEVGTTPEGTIGAPAITDPKTVAWFRGSVSPGEQGSALVTGHVDSDTTRAVFFRLSSLKQGQRVTVDRADGTTAVFAVDSHEYVDRKHFPADRVLAPTSEAHLWLVTCAPPFDHERHEYLANLLVRAHLVQTLPTHP